MKKYKVLRNCSGFKGRRWYQDTIVELEDDATPPHHFELIGSVKKTKKEPVKKEVGEASKSFSEMTYKSKKAPKSGFAKGFDGVQPPKNKTAAQALKNKKK